MADTKGMDNLNVSNIEDTVLFYWVSSALIQWHSITSQQTCICSNMTVRTLNLMCMWLYFSSGFYSSGLKNVLNFQGSGTFVFKIQFIFILSPKISTFQHKSIAISQTHQKTLYKNMCMHVNTMHAHMSSDPQFLMIK
jgi:hypothetical protein